MSVRRRALVVAKAPRTGRSKTRLVPPLSAEAAADLAEAMLRDTLAACAAEVDAVGVLCPDAREGAALTEVLGPGVAVQIQEGRGLATALREEMRTGTAESPLAIVSSDVPGLPPGELARAFTLLEEGADVVFGPGFDGGYWLIAMARFDPAPFDDIPWSTPACLGVTLERIRAAGLSAALLAPWIDIDTSVDLSTVVHAPPGRLGPRTEAALALISAEVAIPPPPPVRLGGSELLRASRWRSAVLDRLETDAGAERDYLYLATPRAVFVVAVTVGGEILLVRQYRHPVRDWTLEVPTGSVDEGESPRDAAGRELAEETGARGGTWIHLGTFFSSSAHLSLRSDAFLATGVHEGGSHPEPDEDVTVVRLPVSEALAVARRGGMVEGQTALCLLLAAPHLE